MRGNHFCSIRTLVDHVWDVCPYYSCNKRNFPK